MATRTPLIRRGATGGLAQDPSYAEFSGRVKINRMTLDTCVEEQSELFRMVGEKFVAAVSVRDKKKDELARRDAEIARDARREADASGEKMTDSKCADAVITHPDHTRLLGQLRDLQKLADEWENLRESFNDRRFMLRDLVQLYSAGYFSTTGVKGAANEVRDALAASARQRQDAARQARKT